MNDLKVAPPYCTPGKQGITDCGFHAGSTAFFFTYVILQTYLLTNLFVAALLDNMASGLLRAKALLGPSHLEHFQVPSTSNESRMNLMTFDVMSHGPAMCPCLRQYEAAHCSVTVEGCCQQGCIWCLMQHAVGHAARHGPTL